MCDERTTMNIEHVASAMTKEPGGFSRLRMARYRNVKNGAAWLCAWMVIISLWIVWELVDCFHEKIDLKINLNDSREFIFSDSLCLDHGPTQSLHMKFLIELSKSSTEFPMNEINATRKTVYSLSSAAFTYRHAHNGTRFSDFHVAWRVSPTKLAHPFQFQLSRLRKRSITVCSLLLFVTFCSVCVFVWSNFSRFHFRIETCTAIVFSRSEINVKLGVRLQISIEKCKKLKANPIRKRSTSRDNLQNKYIN